MARRPSAKTSGNEVEAGSDLKKDLEHVQDLIRRGDSREKYFMLLLGAIFAIGTAISSYSVYDNSERARESVERAEKLVEEMSGLSKPVALAELFPTFSLESGELIAQYYVTEDYLGTGTRAHFTFQAPVSGRIVGAPGKLIGMHFRFDGPIVDWFSTSSGGGVSEVSKRQFGSYVYSPVNAGVLVDGVLVARDGVFSTHASIHRYFRSCFEAKQRVSELISSTEGHVGTIEMQPVFSDIENPPEVYRFPLFITEYGDDFCGSENVVSEPLEPNASALNSEE